MYIYNNYVNIKYIYNIYILSNKLNNIFLNRFLNLPNYYYLLF